MIYKDFGDIAGLCAFYLNSPLLILHGFLCVYAMLKDRARYLNLRNLTYDGPAGFWPVCLCLMPTLYYYLDALHLGAYYMSSFSSRAYFIHHVFGVNMLLFGFQARFTNYTSLLMQITHGALILSFLMPHYVSVVTCNLYFYTGIAMILHHGIAVWGVEGVGRKVAGVGFVLSVGIMAMLRDQQDVFSSCINSLNTPPSILLTQYLVGGLLGLLFVIPPLHHTFFSSSKQL